MLSSFKLIRYLFCSRQHKVLPVIVNGKQIAKDVHKSTKETVAEIKKSTETSIIWESVCIEKFVNITHSHDRLFLFFKNRVTSHT